MGHLRSRFSTHLPATPPVRPQKIRPKSLFRNILPVTPTRSILCADFRLSPPVFSIFYEQGGGGRGVRPIRPFPIWETNLAAPARAAAAHAAVATTVSGHDRAADGATGGVAHVDQLFQRVGGVVVSGG